MVSELEITLVLIFSWIQGVAFGYIVWAPMTSQKKSFLEGMSLKFIWGRFIK
jgi:hypothetical protein